MSDGRRTRLTDTDARRLVCGSHDVHDPNCTWCIDQVCRTHDEHSGAPCPGCGWVRVPLPSWVAQGVVFGWKGRAWRVVGGRGSTNAYHPRAMHFADVVRAEPIEAAGWELPPAPCPREAFGAAIRSLFELPVFRAEELELAVRIVHA